MRDCFILQHSAEGVELTSQVNQRKFFVGEFEAPTLSQLRSRLQQFGPVPAAQENNAKRTDDSDLQHAGSDASSCVGPGREAGWDAEKPQASESDAALQEAVGAAHVSESTKAGDDAAFDELGAASMPSDASTPQLGGLTFSNIADNARSVHMDPANAGSVFQVASQFNCLEMVGPGERPEDGITQYFLDKTQGPACAMACPAATLFRNYFCPVKSLLNEGQALEWSGQLGGSPKQLDTTASVAKLVDNEKHKYWKMSNGYLLPQTTTAMRALGERLKTETVASGSGERVLLAEAVTSSMRVGVHWSTQTATPSNDRALRRAGSSSVGLAQPFPQPPSQHRVCQVLCSAVPVAYAKATNSMDWAPFASVVLDSQYEATLAVGALLALRSRTRVKVFLTRVGGGAFGNRSAWIFKAITRALALFAAFPLDVFLVHYMHVPTTGDYVNLAAKYPAARGAAEGRAGGARAKGGGEKRKPASVRGGKVG